MSYLDIHAHFADEGYDFPAEWEKIRAAGVRAVVLAGDSVPHSKAHRDFCSGRTGAYFTVGVHPSETAGFGKHTLDAVAALARDEKCVAIGEIGLDYHYPDTDKAAQKQAFTAQLELANALGLPVQIHSRDAAEDTLTILRQHPSFVQNGFLLHCYSYGKELLNDFLALGAYFSFGGVVCFKNARRAVESVALCPQDRILSETDSPYLSPFRGQKNTPANIPVIVKRLADIRGEREDDLIAAIERNAHTLFRKL